MSPVKPGPKIINLAKAPSSKGLSTTYQLTFEEIKNIFFQEDVSKYE